MDRARGSSLRLAFGALLELALRLSLLVLKNVKNDAYSAGYLFHHLS